MFDLTVEEGLHVAEAQHAVHETNQEARVSQFISLFTDRNANVAQSPDKCSGLGDRLQVAPVARMAGWKWSVTCSRAWIAARLSKKITTGCVKSSVKRVAKSRPNALAEKTEHSG